MRGVDVRLANEDDAAWFAPRLRLADRLELTAATGPDHEAAIRKAQVSAGGRAFVAVAEEPIAIFGFSPTGMLSSTASPWCVGTDALFQNGRALNTIGRAYCDAALGEFDLLANFVDIRNHRSIRWLTHLGFTMEAPRPYGLQGLPFMRFYRRADVR